MRSFHRVSQCPKCGYIDDWNPPVSTIMPDGLTIQRECQICDATWIEAAIDHPKFIQRHWADRLADFIKKKLG